MVRHGQQGFGTVSARTLHGKILQLEMNARFGHRIMHRLVGMHKNNTVLAWTSTWPNIPLINTYGKDTVLAWIDFVVQDFKIYV